MRRKAKTTVVLLAPAALGTAAGWWCGLTGVDSTVVAAVLPALLTAGGGALLAIRMRRDGGEWTEEFLVICVGVVLLSVSLIAGMHGALAYKNAAYANEMKRERLAARFENYFFILDQCSIAEKKYNAKRVSRGQEPQPAQEVCDTKLIALRAGLKHDTP